MVKNMHLDVQFVEIIKKIKKISDQLYNQIYNILKMIYIEFNSVYSINNLLINNLIFYMKNLNIFVN